MRGRGRVPVRACILVAALTAGVVGGCSAPGALADGSGATACGGDLLFLPGGSPWQPVSSPDRGVGLEGLTRLVNGAAESLLGQGVERLEIQGFVHETRGDYAEVYRYGFGSPARCRARFEALCDAAPLPEGAAGDGRAVSCVAPAGGMTQAFLLDRSDLYELRVSGGDATARDLLRGLARRLAVGSSGPPPEDRAP